MKFDINILGYTMKILYRFLGTPIKFNEMNEHKTK